MNINLKFALRYLSRNSEKTLPRIVSLSLGMFLGVMLLSYVNYRFNFDNFLPDNERIYKIFINDKVNSGELAQNVYGPLAESLARDCPGIESATRQFGPMNQEWTFDDRKFAVNAYAVDSSFFKVLDFGLITGKESTLENDASQVFISEDKAKVIFGEKDPIGQVLLDNMQNPRTVAGVFSEIPYNTSLGKFDVLIAMKGILADSGQEVNTWDAGWCVYTYVKLKKGASPNDVTEWMNNGMLDKYGIRESFTKNNCKFMLIPVKRAEISVGTRRQYMDFFAVLAILVMALCALNYALLSISSLVSRSRTIAVLRCTAANRKDIWSQFMWETFLLLLISSVLVVLGFILMSDRISTSIEAPLTDLFALNNIWVTVCVILALFACAGMIPAGLFASVPTNVAFKGISDRKKGWKQALLVFEIICVSFSSAFLLVSVRQINQLTEKSLGYNPHDMMYVNLVVRGGDALFNAEEDFATLPDVKAVGTSYGLPMSGYMPSTIMLDEQTHEQLFKYSEDYVSDNFFTVMQINFVNGRTFSENGSFDDIIVNRSFLKKAGWDENSLGRIVIEGNNAGDVIREMRIIGVVDDTRTEQGGFLRPIVYHSIRQSVANEDYAYGGFHTIMRVEEVNEEMFDIIDKKLEDYRTMDNEMIISYYDSFMYRMRGEMHFKSILIIVFIITSIIAVIGLTGYIADELKRRRKEIALRKVSGATLKDILIIISRDFSKLAVPAIIAGEILAFCAGRIWIQIFENRIELSWWIFVSTGMATLAVIYAVELLLSIKAANANPVESFKTE